MVSPKSNVTIYYGSIAEASSIVLLSVLVNDAKGYLANTFSVDRSSELPTSNRSTPAQALILWFANQQSKIGKH